MYCIMKNHKLLKLQSAMQFAAPTLCLCLAACGGSDSTVAVATTAAATTTTTAATTTTTTAATGTTTTTVASSTTTTAAGAAPTVPTTAAPAPSHTVLASLFTTSAADVTGTTWNPNWGQGTLTNGAKGGAAVVPPLTIGGAETLAYTLLSYEGINVATLDVSKATKVHMDIWTPNAATVAFGLINSSAITGSGNPPNQFLDPISLTVSTSGTGTWNSIDLPLSDFVGVKMNEIDQMSFTGCNPAPLTPTQPAGLPTCSAPGVGVVGIYVQNLYFY
jgi:hypothetical protein